MAQQRKRNPNGAGTITKRKDGRFQRGVRPPAGRHPCPQVRLRQDVGRVLDTKRLNCSTRSTSMPVPTMSGKLSRAAAVLAGQRHQASAQVSTYDKYEAHVRLYLVPRSALSGWSRLASPTCAGSSSAWRRRPPLQPPRNPTEFCARLSRPPAVRN